MRRRLPAAFIRFGTALSTASLALIAAWCFTSCQSTTTEQAIATEPPTGSYSYPTGSQGGDPYQPVSPDGQTSAPKPTPISFNTRIGGMPDGEAPNITAKAAILVDGFGRVIYEKNADTRLPCASTQKLLLGILVVENGNLSAPVTIQDSDTWAEPTVMGLKTGQVYSRHELLQAVLVRSSNDIANALARDHSGSVSAFVAQMNHKARMLGMNDSYFTNAHGLPSPPGQYSTARDLAKLGAAALRKPEIRSAVSTKGFTFRFADGTTKTCYNTNQVLRSFPYCTGLKTGYTNAAGRCLVSSASANGKSVIAVILGSKSPTVWEESEALLKYGLGM